MSLVVYNTYKEAHNGYPTVYGLIAVPDNNSSVTLGAEHKYVGNDYQKQIRTNYKSSQNSISFTYITDNIEDRFKFFDFFFNVIKGRTELLAVPTYTNDIELYSDYLNGDNLINIKYNGFLTSIKEKRLTLFHKKTKEFRGIVDIIYQVDEITSEPYLTCVLEKSFSAPARKGECTFCRAFITRATSNVLPYEIVNTLPMVKVEMEFKEITTVDTNRLVPLTN